MSAQHWLRSLLLSSVYACGNATPNDSSDHDAAIDASLARPPDGGHDGSSTDARSPDGGRDGSSTDAGSSAPPDAGLCRDEAGSCPASASAKWKVLLRAQALDPTAHFVAADMYAILALTATGDVRVAITKDPGDSEDVDYAVWSAPKGPLTPVAATSGRLAGAPAQEPFVLSCNDARTQCEILRGRSGQSELESFAASALPAGFAARGLVVDTAATPTKLCVYGSGIYCFDQGWQPSLPLADGLKLNHVAIGYPWSLAVGDDGRWFKREQGASGSAWQAQSTLGKVNLTQAGVTANGGFVLGDGQVRATLGALRPAFRCQASAALRGLVLNEGVEGLADAITLDGKIFQYQLVDLKSTYCTTQELDQSDLLSVTSAPCGGSQNPRVVTPSVLVGMHLCVVL